MRINTQAYKNTVSQEYSSRQLKSNEELRSKVFRCVMSNGTPVTKETNKELFDRRYFVAPNSTHASAYVNQIISLSGTHGAFHSGNKVFVEVYAVLETGEDV